MLDATGTQVAVEVLKEIRGRLGFLIDVGLEYLMLDRTAPTLSGGEAQRIRLAGQIGCGLVGVLYILDEPSIGLHPRDNDRLLATLPYPVEEFDLAQWTTPLLPRIRHATGLRYTESDQAQTEAAGAKAFLLDFSAERPDPSLYDKASNYLAGGVLDELPARYKCRIREPWYRVPFIRAGRLMMSKRSQPSSGSRHRAQ